MYCQIFNETTNELLLKSARILISIEDQKEGLQHRDYLPEFEGLLFIDKTSSIENSTIHMRNMNFPIGVVWMNVDGMCIDKKLAVPSDNLYAPNYSASYCIEATPDILDRVWIGSQIRIEITNPDLQNLLSLL